MKKYLTLGVLCLCLGFTSSAFAERVQNIRDLDTNHNGIYEEGEVDPCAEYQSGPCVCYCPVTKFRPVKYCEKECIKEPYTVNKKCCRYVDQPYTKKCCRYVPEYYEKSYCRKVPEYYCVPETRYRTRYVTHERCRYVPYTCVEKRCIDAPNGCATCAMPSNNGAPAEENHNHEEPVGANHRSGSRSASSNMVADSGEQMDSGSSGAQWHDSSAFQSSDQGQGRGQALGQGDGQLLEKVQGTLKEGIYGKTYDFIQAQAVRGAVTLTGTVNSHGEKFQIQTRIESIPEVVSVNNMIEVKPLSKTTRGY